MNKSIGRLVSILHRQSQVFINNQFKDYNISSAEYSFIFYLYKNDGATQDEMSNYLCIDKSATARAIKSLEQKGYVQRFKDLKDKRFNRVYLTKHTKNIKNDILKKLNNWNMMLTKDMSHQEIETIFNLLEKMVNSAEAINKQK